MLIFHQVRPRRLTDNLRLSRRLFFCSLRKKERKNPIFLWSYSLLFRLIAIESGRSLYFAEESSSLHKKDSQRSWNKMNTMTGMSRYIIRVVPHESICN